MPSSGLLLIVRAPMATGRGRKILLSFILVGVVAQAVFWALTRAAPPDVPIPASAPIVFDGDRATLGGSFLERRRGHWLFVHRGTPVEMGHHHARLGEFITQRVEDQMFDDFSTRVPGIVGLLLPPVLLWQYRHMPGAVPSHLREELWGFAGTYADRHGFPLSSYQRGFYYHALHDITQELVGNPWVDPAVAGACTALAVTGHASTNGHTLVGRNFDFEVFPIFDDEKVVHLFVRDGAIPVVSVSWMAMMGVVTGMNAEGIWVSINAARTEGRNRRGPPVALLVRDVLERARTVDEAEALIRAATPLVADLYLIGEAGTVRVVERGTDRSDVRASKDGRITLANHVRTATFAGDAQDAALRTWSTTEQRGARMDELAADGPFDVPALQRILRDRRGPGGADLPLGDRRAIDALIATHSVIADLHDRVLWVSSAPNTQGTYEPFDLLAELEAIGLDTAPHRQSLRPGARPWELDPTAPRPAALPPGDLVGTDAWDRLLRYRALIADVERYLAHDQFAPALDVLGRAAALNPTAPEIDGFRALSLLGLGREPEARAAYDAYVGARPSPGPLLGTCQRAFAAAP